MRHVIPSSFENVSHLIETFNDDRTCIEYLEKLRWPKGVVCPLCGEKQGFYRIARGHRFRCNHCKHEFGVRKGTIFEDSRLPLHKWFAAVWLVSQDAQGVKSTQLAREIDVTQKTAWLMLRRLRDITSQLAACGTSSNTFSTMDSNVKEIDASERV